MRRIGATRALGAALGLGALLACGHGVASAEADPQADPRADVPSHAAAVTHSREAVSRQRSEPPTPKPGNVVRAAQQATGRVAAAAQRRVSVNLPPMPVTRGRSFTVSPESVAEIAGDYVAAGGDPADAPRFFFGDLAVASLEGLAAREITGERVRTELGNLAVSGYFGGVWLRDDLRGAPAVPVAGEVSAAAGLSASAIAIGLFDALAAGLVRAAASSNRWVVTTVAHASVPALLALYGYNRGYLEFLLENPPAGVASMRDTLNCTGFLSCSSTAFPLEIADRYDAALADLDTPPTLGWREMKAWSALLEGATGAGRFVWRLIAGQSGFSPASYQALVELSSAYLMVSKAAVLSAMLAAADGDADTGASSLRLQAGLWMWSGAYFGGLASAAPPGTQPAIMLS